MPGELESPSRGTAVPSDDGGPDVSVCRSGPGTVVFLEAGNTDGWIATDSVVDLPP